MSEYRRILVVRRDNIGDLVLTTPLIHALRQRFPSAWIAALTNSYNAPVLEGNGDLDAVYAYDKAKHRPDRTRIGVAISTARLLLQLRHEGIDLAILAAPGYQRQAARLVKLVGARDVLGFAAAEENRSITLPLEYGAGAQLHAAEDVFRLLAPLGVQGGPGPCRMTANPAAVAAVRARLGNARGPLVAVHISARRPRQQWPAQRFAEVIAALHRRCGTTAMLLWAPGAADDPRHPGDDAKAREVQALAGDAPVIPMATTSLGELAGALACADLMLCIDGGAMHVTAALGRPVVALFGDSPVHRWRPWGVPQRVIAAAGGDLAPQAAAPVIEAAVSLLAEIAAARA
ncbi:MAG TPA: glycosyltransferase family 9 protein [Burkholderiales bacterium]